jgi:hypothetical protein
MGTLTELKGKNALNLNDLAELEDQFGPLDQIDLARFVVIRRILWLVVKKTEPEITENQVGERFTMDTMQEEVTKVLRASGLLPAEEASGGKGEATGEA